MKTVGRGLVAQVNDSIKRFVATAKTMCNRCMHVKKDRNLTGVVALLHHSALDDQISA